MKKLIASPVVEEIKRSLKERVFLLKQKGMTPKMCVVLVGNNPASLTYINNKKKICLEVGAEFQLEHLSEKITSDEFCDRLNTLNNDPDIHGIIIQLPVTKDLSSLDIMTLVHPEKDIDGFHPLNISKLYSLNFDQKTLLPCTPKGVLKLLDYYGEKIEGKNVLIIGRSLIVGKPLSLLMNSRNATVTLAHSKTKNLNTLADMADIIVMAVGKPLFLDHSFFSTKKERTLIDVGINSVNGKIVGDFLSEGCESFVTSYTPVPGGVGPMTVISLIENLILSCENKRKA